MFIPSGVSRNTIKQKVKSDFTVTTLVSYFLHKYYLTEKLQNFAALFPHKISGLYSKWC